MQPGLSLTKVTQSVKALQLVVNGHMMSQIASIADAAVLQLVNFCRNNFVLAQRC